MLTVSVNGVSTTGSLRGTLIGIIPILIWGCALPFMRFASEPFGAITSGVIQFSFSGVLLFIIFILTGRLKDVNFIYKKEFWIRFALFVIYPIFLNLAIGTATREQMPMVILINYLWPTLTIIFTVFFLKLSIKKPLFIFGSVSVIFGIALETVGINYTSFASADHILINYQPYFFSFINAVGWAAYITYYRVKGELTGGLSAMPFLLIGTSFSLLLLSYYIPQQVSGDVNEALPYLIYLSFTPAISQVCWDYATQKGNITYLSLMADGIPWMSLAVTSILLSVSISFEAWIAAAFIVIGAVLTRFAIIDK